MCRWYKLTRSATAWTRYTNLWMLRPGIRCTETSTQSPWAATSGNQPARPAPASAGASTQMPCPWSKRLRGPYDGHCQLCRLSRNTVVYSTVGSRPAIVWPKSVCELLYPTHKHLSHYRSVQTGLEQALCTITSPLYHHSKCNDFPCLHGLVGSNGDLNCLQSILVCRQDALGLASFD